MKVTLDLNEELLGRARRHARRVGQPLKAVVEEGLKRVLAGPVPAPERFQLPDLSVGERGAENPLEGLRWDDLRSQVHGGR